MTHVSVGLIRKLYMAFNSEAEFLASEVEVSETVTNLVHGLFKSEEYVYRTGMANMFEAIEGMSARGLYSREAMLAFLKSNAMIMSMEEGLFTKIFNSFATGEDLRALVKKSLANEVESYVVSRSCIPIKS